MPILKVLASFQILRAVLLPIFIIYALFYYIDLSELKGGRTNHWARRFSPVTKWLHSRYSLKVLVSEGKNSSALFESSKHASYLFCVHPHGILPFGSFTALFTEFEYGSGDEECFSKIFPRIPLRFLAASFCFYVPLYRDFLLSLGGVDASRVSAQTALKAGSSIVLCPGGGKLNI